MAEGQRWEVSPGQGWGKQPAPDPDSDNKNLVPMWEVFTSSSEANLKLPVSNLTDNPSRCSTFHCRFMHDKKRKVQSTNPSKHETGTCLRLVQKDKPSILSDCLTGWLTIGCKKKGKYAVKFLQPNNLSNGRKTGNTRQGTEVLQRWNVSSGSTNGHSRPVGWTSQKGDHSHEEFCFGSEHNTAWFSSVDSLYATKQR